MIESLPEHLLERTRIHNGKAVDDNAGSQRVVLYWMRTAVRSEENPALDVVRWLADHQDIPLLIYHAISEHYEYASDRHHMFMLQGARDVQRQFKQLGLDYAFHLATGEDREPHLDSLANMTRVVVTEDHFQMAAGGVGQSEDENWGCNRPQGDARLRRRNPGPPRWPGKTCLSRRLWVFLKTP